MLEILMAIWDFFNIGGTAILAAPPLITAVAAAATAGATGVGTVANIAQASNLRKAQEEERARAARSAPAPAPPGQNPIADPTQNIMAQLQQLAQSGNIPTPKV
jgi:hypothetical protein